jgi:hypothetical protein
MDTHDELLDAVRRDDPQAVARLAGDDDACRRDGRPWSCLAEALRLGHRACALRLMEAMPRLSVAARDWALHGMIEGPIDDPVLFMRLRDRGADLPYDPGGRQIEHTLALAGRPGVVAALARRGKLCPGVLDPDGWTPFLRAIRAGDTATAQVFLDHGENVNVRIEWRDRRSALHLALEAPDAARVVGWLLARGIDTRLVDERGRTAEQLAQERGEVDLARAMAGHRGSGGPRWHREAVERGISKVVCAFLTRGDGFMFDPREASHPFLIGGDHDGIRPNSPAQALDHIRSHPVGNEQFRAREPWVPIIGRMIAGADVGLDELLPLGRLIDRPFM